MFACKKKRVNKLKPKETIDTEILTLYGNRRRICLSVAFLTNSGVLAWKEKVYM